MSQKKKRALLVTWFDGCNYGTVLQCFCLKKIIEDPSVVGFGNVDFDTEVKVLNYSSASKKTSLSKKIKEVVSNDFRENARKLKNKISIYRYNLSTKAYGEKILEREELFADFRKKNFDFCPIEPICDFADLRKINEFDSYIVGSDQVWNPNLLDPVYLLGWVDYRKNKFSYAPSLCVDHIPRNKEPFYALLGDFNNISVREDNNAAKQLAEITRKDVKVVSDPVLLYGRESLLKLCKPSNDKYIMSYFLGNNEASRKFFKNFGKKNNIKMKSIINVNPLHAHNDTCLLKYADWKVGPTEIVNKIFNSEVVFTDSFHVMVLAVLLHKDFVVFSREKSRDQQNNRIISFLKLIDLERLYNHKPEKNEEIHIDKLQWEKIDKIIEAERKKSFEYLVGCINYPGDEENEAV